MDKISAMKNYSYQGNSQQMLFLLEFWKWSLVHFFYLFVLCFIICEKILNLRRMDPCANSSTYMEKERQRIAQELQCDPHHIFFVSADTPLNDPSYYETSLFMNLLLKSVTFWCFFTWIIKYKMSSPPIINQHYYVHVDNSHRGVT